MVDEATRPYIDGMETILPVSAILSFYMQKYEYTFVEYMNARRRRLWSIGCEWGYVGKKLR